ncbi:MAG: D-Ala-D-Ala carboxypeptidase family metallohydrolase [Candidatus Melainabacteria bacterium]|nr:D-Ala-D-Ala carboxypeptidase family metallohydrolase [Candidatus Melainabacteria bacterium]
MKDEAGVIYLTPHFRLDEFVQADTPMPAPWILDNLYRLAHRLQVVRDVINRPMHITSGYRTREHNRQVGGTPNSLHMSGMAADVVVPGMPAAALQKILRHWSGGMGEYTHFTHLDIRSHRARWR